MIAALQTVVPDVGATAISLLESPQTPITSVLATLLNDLSGLPRDIVLVLDDYHVVDANDIQDGMAFLLEHLPPQVHLVVTTRADPALPLGSPGAGVASSSRSARRICALRPRRPPRTSTR